MSRTIGIAGIQMAPIAWDPQATLAKIEEVIGGARRSFPWIELVLLPELAVPGVVHFSARPDPEARERIIDTIPGVLSDRLCDLARRERLWLVPGSLYERAGEEVFNTALAISPAGEIVARYRKIFPWLPYEAGIAAGSAFSVFDIPEVGRFGLSICYDMWFPETVRTLAWMGAEAILHPTLTPTSDRELELVLARANAITNQCYFIDINGVGPWGGGRSLLVDPDGRVLQQAGTAEMVMTEILDLDRVQRTREFGTLGLSQLLKQLRDSGVDFPPYRRPVGPGEGFERLGPLELPRRLR